MFMPRAKISLSILELKEVITLIINSEKALFTSQKG